MRDSSDIFRRVAILAVLLGLAMPALAPGPARAEAPKPFPDFSAKRVKPPAKGARKRINVQIAPRQAALPQIAAPDSPKARAAAAVGNYGWFWDGISPALSDSGPGRLEPALVRLANPPQGLGVTAPRIGHLRRIIEAQGADILRATIGRRVSPALVLAVIAVESGGRADAVSSAGAQGLMQLMPATAERFGVADSLSAPENIGGGVQYLDWLMERFGGDPILALAGYNAGENSVTKHDGVPPYGETRDYVPKVLAAYNVARGLCQTPPQLISDGCVFSFR